MVSLDNDILVRLIPIYFFHNVLRDILNIWIKINDVLVSLMTISFTQYSLYWIQHVAMLFVPFLLNAQVFLFVEQSKSLFFFLRYLCN